MTPVDMGDSPVAHSVRILSPLWMLPLCVGSLYSGTSGIHELGIRPGSSCDQGGGIGKRGSLSGGCILGTYIRSWVRKCGVVVDLPVTSTTGIWYQPAGAIPLLVAAGGGF